MSRPRKPQDHVLDGDDYNTRTKYLGPEYVVGDSLKVVLLQVFDMAERDNLQIYEIKALLNALIDQHLVEF